MKWQIQHYLVTMLIFSVFYFIVDNLDEGTHTHTQRDRQREIMYYIPFQVKVMSFYDIVIDFLLFDAFDDLDNPPSSVTTVIQNRWLSNGFKETVCISV